MIVTADLLPVATSDVEPAPGEPWARWWAEVAADPLLVSSLCAARRAGAPDDLPSGDHLLTVDEHLTCARDDGWAAREIWRQGTRAVILAERAREPGS